MPPAMPVLIYALDTNGNAHPVRVSGTSLNINVDTERDSAEQHFTTGSGTFNIGDNTLLGAPGETDVVCIHTAL